MTLRDWLDSLDERTGWKKIKEVLLDRKIPEAQGWKGWLYTLGSASLFLILVQLFTGILLAMNYANSPDHAYDSVRFIMEKVSFGSLVRGIHKWGATLMVIVVFLHMLRTFFMGSYKFPREGTWVVGVILFLLVMGFGFTGYLLPWDQKAYWATQVGVHIAGQTPVIGPYIVKALQGGDELGATTLSRFYAFHVLVLPTITFLLIGVHLFLVVWHGISDPPSKKNNG
jgi:quinol-cytochrome oxidoreductase complex cytochrome b subunit